MRTCSICQKNHDFKLINTCKTCYHRNWRKLNSDKNLAAKRKYYRKIHNLPSDYVSNKRKDGEGNIDTQGYKTITKRNHPNRMDGKGRIREHVFVMSEYLGRPLMKGESIHHKNGDRLDNRIENLELWNKAQPAGQRVEDKIKFYIKFLSSYGYEVKKVL